MPLRLPLLLLLFARILAQDLSSLTGDQIKTLLNQLSAQNGAAAPAGAAASSTQSSIDGLQALGRGLSSGGLLNNLFNSAQLGLKNVVDQLVPNVQIPAVLPDSVPDLSLGDLRLPQLLGGGQLLPNGCPVCNNLDPTSLVRTWVLSYANDNFLKSRIALLGKLARSLQPTPNFPSGASTFNSIQNLFNPIRLPVCVRLQIGVPRSFGFLLDFPVLLSYHEGRPKGPLRSIPGNLRQVDEGKYLLMFAGGSFFIRFCAVAGNIFTPLYPPRAVPNVFNPPLPIQPQSFAGSQDSQPDSNSSSSSSTSTSTTTPTNPILRQQQSLPAYFVLTDTGGFPACQNYLVLTSNPDAFLRTYDPVVSNFIRRQGADSDSNPLQYLACPAAAVN